MLLSQTIGDVGITKDIVFLGVYYDEVSLTGTGSYGMSRKAHIEELTKRSGSKRIFGCKFDVRPSRTAHPDYNQIIVSVTGDEIQ